MERSGKTLVLHNLQMNVTVLLGFNGWWREQLDVVGEGCIVRNVDSQSLS